jgi:hypothetical protein
MICLATLYDLHCRLAAPELGLSGAERQRLLDEYLPHARRVELPAREGAAGAASTTTAAQDPPAVTLVRLAAAVRAHAIVTADAGLLTLNGRLGCPVLTLDTLLDGLPVSRSSSSNNGNGNSSNGSRQAGDAARRSSAVLGVVGSLFLVRTADRRAA